MIIKKEGKKVLTIFLFVLIVILSNTLVLSQSEEQGSSSYQDRCPLTVSYGDKCIQSIPTVTYSDGSVATDNFVVSGCTPQENVQLAKCAEHAREALAKEFTGKPLPGKWSTKVPVRVRCHPQLGAGGATSFKFDQGEVFRWDMKVQGSKEKLCSSVIPHEVMHTISASTFRKPLPRWIDEGVSSTIEDSEETSKYHRNEIEFLKTGRGIPFSVMMNMKDYPEDVMPLYTQGESATYYLILLGGGGTEGRRKLWNFMKDAMRDDNWDRALNKYYGFKTPREFQDAWLDRLKRGF